MIRFKLTSLTVLFSLLLIPGCKYIDKIPDDKLQSYIQTGAEKAVQYGLNYAISKSSDSGAKIKADATIAGKVLKEDVIPAFSGDTTKDVLRSAVDTALALLSSKITPQIQAVIQLAIDLLYTQVTLPANPTDKIDPRTKGALLGLFTGMSIGVDDVTSKALAPASNGISWPK